MAFSAPPRGNSAITDDHSFSSRFEAREPGARRKKLAGYLKAANDLRQSYFGVDSNLHHEPEDGPGSFPDAAVVRSGKEEMVLFPSYGKFHLKRRAKPMPPRSGEDVSEEEYWRREWSAHEDSNAVVDIDVRGWIYTPHRGPNTRKQRLLIGLARQLSGLPAPAPRPGDSAAASYSTEPSNDNSSPTPSFRQEEDLIQLEAENLVRRGRREEQYASRGAFSETPSRATETDSIYGDANGKSSAANLSSSQNDNITGVASLQKRSSWSSTTKLTPNEAAIANKNLLTRLQPFMHNPLANSPISAFFYNEKVSKQRTIYTDASGHFHFHTALDFVPTHVRVLAAEKLSVTEEVMITDQRGVSLISDIDDTIKHSAISAGPREIFRNAFLRDMSDLMIDGVREWYNTLADMGVQFHYVSNSPWQMYPALTTFFKLAHLPRGSFHLKQYTGMLQGIFEPVAERKKSSLDKIMRDFPDRRFILVGDSGEADLEVYTDVALDNPGRILAIFIRDVTTSARSGYFDSNTTPPGGSRGSSRIHSRHPSSDNLANSKKLSRSHGTRDEDADLKAAIAASLQDMERETGSARKAVGPNHSKSEAPRVPPRRSTVPPPKVNASADEEDLIDFSDDKPAKPWLAPPARRSESPETVAAKNDNKPHKPSPSPPPPPKPASLKVTPSAVLQNQAMPVQRKPPPPRPSKPSNAIKPLTPILSESNTPAPALTAQPSPLSDQTTQPKVPPPLPARRTYREFAKDTISRALPTSGASWTTDAPFRPSRSRAGSRAGGSQPSSPLARGMTTASADAPASFDDLMLPDSALPSTSPGRPPLPARRNLSSYSLATRRSLHRRSGSWGGGDDDPGWNGSSGGDAGNGGGSLPGSPGLEGMSKKEYLWRQRRARSQSLLERQGVTLRTWRVGADVADLCVKLAESVLRSGPEAREKEGGR